MMMTNIAEHGDGWCILRTSGPSTLRLAASLVEAGMDAWAPETIVTRRVGRSRERVEKPAAILPTFVFAKAMHIGELQRCRSMLVNPHPSFSIFRHMGRYPIVAEREIATLRAEEEKAKRTVAKRTRRTVPLGSKITVTEGAFAGLTGVVERSDGKSTLVCFGGGFSVSIAAWLLPDDQIDPGLSNTDPAAQAA
jgi:hypothetical protein